MANYEILEPPTDCLEIDGFILVIEEGKSWLTQDGDLTTEWGLRGVWETPGEAEAVKAESIHRMDKQR